MATPCQDTLTVFVTGRPAPQGSKRHVGNGVMVESSKAVKPWRQDIREALLPHGALAHPGDAVTVGLEFVMPRPASTPRRRTPAAIKRPDLDKLIRAVLDAIGSAGTWRDDSQVVHLVASKRLADPGEPTGCRIQITPIREEVSA